MLAAWILFKTQLDIIESMVRSITDIVWTGSHRARALSRGDVRVVYYGALAIVCVWGMIALRLAQPIMLLMLAANIAGLVFTIASLHLLYLNTRLLPAALRPPLWRRCASIVAMSVFYGSFYDAFHSRADVTAKSVSMSRRRAAGAKKMISPAPLRLCGEDMEK